MQATHRSEGDQEVREPAVDHEEVIDLISVVDPPTLARCGQVNLPGASRPHGRRLDLDTTQLCSRANDKVVARWLKRPGDAHSAECEPPGREQRSRAVEMGDVGTWRSLRLWRGMPSHMVDVETEPGRVTFDGRDRRGAVKSQRIGHLKPGGRRSDRRAQFGIPTTLPDEVSVVVSQLISARPHGPECGRRRPDEAKCPEDSTPRCRDHDGFSELVIRVRPGSRHARNLRPPTNRPNRDSRPTARRPTEQCEAALSQIGATASSPGLTSSCTTAGVDLPWCFVITEPIGGSSPLRLRRRRDAEPQSPREA